MVPCEALKNTTLPKTRCRKPYAATQHLMLLMMGYVPETCRAKNTSIKLPCCIKLAFQIISKSILLCRLYPFAICFRTYLTYCKLQNKTLLIRNLTDDGNSVIFQNNAFYEIHNRQRKGPKLTPL